MKNTNMETENESFVMLPRKIRTDYLERKLSKKQYDVLVWVWHGTNPVDGSFSTSYDGLVQDFRGEISEVNARKIISSLRKWQYIFFTNHKGVGGSFLIYPVNFPRTNRRIQTWEYLKNKEQITTPNQTQAQSSTMPNHNFDPPNHNPQSMQDVKNNLKKQFSMDNLPRQITTAYNNTDNKNNK